MIYFKYRIDFYSLYSSSFSNFNVTDSHTKFIRFKTYTYIFISISEKEYYAYESMKLRMILKCAFNIYLYGLPDQTESTLLHLGTFEA